MNRRKILAVLTSCILTCAVPMSALCSEAVTEGNTSAAIETEFAAEAEEEIADAADPAEVTDAGAEAESVETYGEDAADDSAAETVTEDEGEAEDTVTVPEEETGEPAVTTGTCGEELTWEYIEGALYIKGTGEMYDYDEEKRPEWEVYKDEITKLYIEKEITLIDGDAFEGLTKLDTIFYDGNEKEWTELEYTGEKEKEEVFENVLNYNFAEAEEVPGEETDTEAAETEAADTEAAEAEETEIVTETEEADANDAAAAGDLAFVTEPEDVVAAENASVVLKVKASGSNVTYQWQYTKDGGATWIDCKSGGYNTDTFTFVMKAALAGRRYRCVISAGGEELASRGAKISLEGQVVEEVEITEQPKNVTASAGETVTFHVAANNADVTYLWQWSSDGTTWKNCSSGGFDTDTFKFTMKDALDGRKYRCVVKLGTETAVSNVVKATLGEPLKITVDLDEETAAVIGSPVKLHVETNKPDSVTYQWQYSKNNGAKWLNCKSSGCDTDTFKFTMKAALIGRMYRCVVKLGNVQRISGKTLIKEKEPTLKITEQPKDTEAEVDTTVTLHVAANEEDVTYQWQYSKDGGATWLNCKSGTYTTDTFSFLMKEALDGRYYRCAVSTEGETVNSDGAKITLPDPTIEIDGVIYKLIDDVMTVIDYIGSASSVTVQETVAGRTVTVIGESAFENKTSITQIDLPDTIVLIKKRAFAGCSNLANMN